MKKSALFLLICSTLAVVSLYAARNGEPDPPPPPEPTILIDLKGNPTLLVNTPITDKECPPSIENDVCIIIWYTTDDDDGVTS